MSISRKEKRREIEDLRIQTDMQFLRGLRLVFVAVVAASSLLLFAVFSSHSSTSGTLGSRAIRRMIQLVADITSNEESSPATAKLPQLALFSEAYKRVHPDWQRGGAWMFHDDHHPCDTFGKTCTLVSHEHEKQPATFHLNTTIVPHLGFLNVSFTLPALHQANVNDTIAVYCVDEEEHPDVRHVDLDFFDYIYVGDERAVVMTHALSRGSVVFGPLANQRCSYQFRYLKYEGDLVYRLWGESAHVEMEMGHSEPVEIHIAVTDRSDTMRVMWTSGRVVDPSVRYGSQSSNLSVHSLAATESYRAEDMCNGLARREVASFYRHPGYLHDATLTGLVPGERYFYKVGSADGMWSQEISFVVPPAPGTDTASSGDAGSRKPQSFFVFGDLGDHVLAKSTKAKEYASFIDGESVAARSGSVMDLIAQDYRANEWSYLAVLHVGDISYARGRTFLWDQFGAMVQPIASKLPYMVALGNHEYDYTSGGERDVSGAGATNGWHPAAGNYKQDSGGECGLPAAKRFHMPDNGNQMFWYSFEMGLVHHTIISSEHDYSAESRMYKWLERDLASVDRGRTPWLFLHLHRPMYCSQRFEPDYNVSLLIRAALEPLVSSYHVDVVFGGHYHAYERTCAVLGETCRYDSDGWALAPVHIMVGAAGAVLDDAEYWPKPWSVSVQAEYGYGRMHIYNSSHARFEFVRAKGRLVSDAVWVMSSHDW